MQICLVLATQHHLIVSQKISGGGHTMYTGWKVLAVLVSFSVHRGISRKGKLLLCKYVQHF